VKNNDMFNFVYKTINPINKKFYIGKHSTKNLNDNYQGSGKWIKDCKKSNIHLITGIIKFCKSEDEAYFLEEKLVEKFIHNKLCMNFINGGKGLRAEYLYGEKNPAKRPEVRKILSEQKIGKLNPMYGKPIHKGIPKTEEHKKKLSELRKNNPKYNGVNHPMYGKKPKTDKCIYCDKIVNVGNLAKWHNDNCKEKFK